MCKITDKILSNMWTMVNQHGDMWGSSFGHIQQQATDFPFEEDITISKKGGNF